MQPAVFLQPSEIAVHTLECNNQLLNVIAKHIVLYEFPVNTLTVFVVYIVMLLCYVRNILLSMQHILNPTMLLILYWNMLIVAAKLDGRILNYFSDFCSAVVMSIINS